MADRKTLEHANSTNLETIGRRHRSGRTAIWALAVIAIAVGAAIFVSRTVFALKPTPLGTITSSPLAPAFQDGRWYWIEKPKEGPSRLVRTGPGGVEQIASADAISGFGAQGDWVALAAREGDRSTIYAWSGPGRKNSIWSDAREIVSAGIWGRDIYWLVKLPSAISGNLPQPAMAPRLLVMSAPASGGQAREIATLLESDGLLLGLHNSTLYVAGYRPGPPGNTALYKIAVAGGVVTRVGGDAGRASALLDENGILYWVGPSRESSDVGNASCIRSLKPGGKPETYCEWLPAHGTVWETARGIVYVDGSVVPRAWLPLGHEAFPRPIGLPAEFIPIACGKGEVLVSTYSDSLTRVQLSRIGLP